VGIKGGDLELGLLTLCMVEALKVVRDMVPLACGAGYPTT
jgi:hypothetical protein